MEEKIIFYEDKHIYLLNDWLVLPSVTQLLKKVFPKKYEGVPENILKAKSDYGTKVHKCIEIIETKKPKKPIAYCKRYLGIDMYQEESIKQYLELKEKYNIEVLESEKIVHYKNLYAGTLDIKGTVNGISCIIDIKTTYELDKEYVGWQNSLYEMADEPVEKLFCLWLPKKRYGKLVEVNRIEQKKLLEVVENGK